MLSLSEVVGSSYLKGNNEKDIQHHHGAGDSTISDTRFSGRRLRLKWAGRGQSDPEAAIHDSQENQETTDPEMDASNRCTTGPFGGFASCRVQCSLLVDAMMHEAENGLEEGNGEDGQAQTGVSIVPDAVCGRLLGKPDAHTCSDNEDYVTEDLPNRVDSQDNGIFEVESKKNR